MILREIYQRYRKTEPLSIHVIRIITMLLSLICITIFTINIIFDIINDQPVINYSYIKEDMPMPDVQIFSEKMFMVTCKFGIYDYQTQNNTYSEECNLYCTDPFEKNGSSYNGYFSVPLENKYKLLLFSGLSNNTQYGKHDEIMIIFTLQFLDSNMYQNASSRFSISVFDAENTYLEENISSRFLQSIKKANTHEIITGQTRSLYLSRSIRKIIIPNWKATMGFQPDYKIIPYLTTRTAVARTEFRWGVTEMSFVAEFDITFVETEQRTHTVLSSLGLLGGAWSLAIAIYKLLFGGDAIQPFGLTQKHGYFYEKSQKKITKYLPTFPLVQLPGTSNNIDDENRAEQLEKKISDLELFLRDYVVEVQQLDKIYKNIENNKDS